MMTHAEQLNRIGSFLAEANSTQLAKFIHQGLLVADSDNAPSQWCDGHGDCDSDESTEPCVSCIQRWLESEISEE